MFTENEKVREAIVIGVVCAIGWFAFGPIGLGIAALYFMTRKKN